MHSVDLSYKVMLWDEVKPVGAGYLCLCLAGIGNHVLLD